MNRTSIEWTHRPQTGGAAGGYTWNPIHAHKRGSSRTGNFCTKISPGCANCYASRINGLRGNGLEYTVPNLAQAEFYLDERGLAAPLKRKKPATIFVGDMFDLFHEAIPVEMIAEVLRVAWKVQWHTFMFLTKRADRMQRVITEMLDRWGEPHDQPRPNMWFGVSVESQQYVDERIPHLLRTPAAIRFLSVEPMLEAVDLSTWIGDRQEDVIKRRLAGCSYERQFIDWAICGFESGPKARPGHLDWAELLLKQCDNAGVAFFMKQMGSAPVRRFEQWEERHNPVILPNHRRYADTDIWLKAPRPSEKTWRKHLPDEMVALALKDRKGGNPEEWPARLRVREWPA